MSWWSSATTTNIIDSSVSSMTSVGNVTKQTCAPLAAQTMKVTAKSCGNTVIRGNTFSQKQVMDVTCAQNAAQQANSQMNVDQKADQMAKSLTAALALTPGSAEATNITKMSMAIGTVVKNKIDQTLNSASAAAIDVYVNSCPSSPGYSSEPHDISIIDNQFLQFSNTIANLSQTSSQISSAVNSLKQYVKQVADAKRPGLFGDFGPIVAVVVAVIALAFAAKMMRKRGLTQGGSGDAKSARIIRNIVLSLAALAVALFAL
jgi:hypothetical protein